METQRADQAPSVAQTAQATDEAQAASPLPPDPTELADDTVQDIPQLAKVRDQLRIVFVCATQYVGTAETAPIAGQVSPAEALEELQLAQGWTRETISAACEAVMESLGDVWIDLNDRYRQSTEEGETARQGLLQLDELAERLSAEQNEQSSLVKQSQDILALIATVRAKLGLEAVKAGPGDGAQSDLVEGETIAEGILSKLRRFGGLVGGAFFETSRPVEVTTPAAPRVEPGWLTPPVLKADDPELRRFTGIVARRAQAAADAVVAWSGLRGLGLDKQTVTALIDRVEGQAQQQLAQSAKIVQEVGKSYGRFQQEIETNQRIRVIVRNVHAFFFSKEA
jgi:hypothetical protein